MTRSVEGGVSRRAAEAACPVGTETQSRDSHGPVAADVLSTIARAGHSNNINMKSKEVVPLTKKAGQYRLAKRVLVFLAVALIALVILAIVGAATAHGGGALLVLALLGKYVIPIASCAGAGGTGAIIASVVCHNREEKLLIEANGIAIHWLSKRHQKPEAVKEKYFGEYVSGRTKKLIEIELANIDSLTKETIEKVVKEYQEDLTKVALLAKIAKQDSLAVLANTLADLAARVKDQEDLVSISTRATAELNECQRGEAYKRREKEQEKRALLGKNRCE